MNDFYKSFPASKHYQHPATTAIKQHLSNASAPDLSNNSNNNEQQKP